MAVPHLKEMILCKLKRLISWADSSTLSFPSIALSMAGTFCWYYNKKFKMVSWFQRQDVYELITSWIEVKKIIIIIIIIIIILKKSPTLQALWPISIIWLLMLWTGGRWSTWGHMLLKHLASCQHFTYI